MTGITYTLTLQDQEAERRLSAMVARMNNPSAFYKDVGEHLLNSALDNFEREAGPDGKAWERLMPRTIKERERKRLTPIRILRARGRLAGSLNLTFSDTEARIGTPVPYAAIHQLGGKIKKPERRGTIYQHYDAKADVVDQRFRKKSKSNFARDVTIKAHDIEIDARPYLGIGAQDIPIIFEIAERWLNGD
jgi:phage virion morphogenesis protein